MSRIRNLQYWHMLKKIKKIWNSQLNFLMDVLRNIKVKKGLGTVSNKHFLMLF
jgi:hypothetical protein